MQAARGTSLSPHDDSSLADSHHVPSRARVRVLLFGVFGVFFALDQLTKWLAVERLTGEPDRELLGQFLVLHLTRNAGAAFESGEVLPPYGISIAARLIERWYGKDLPTRSAF